jgi:hypothetical protein
LINYSAIGRLGLDSLSRPFSLLRKEVDAQDEGVVRIEAARAG